MNLKTLLSTGCLCLTTLLYGCGSDPEPNTSSTSSSSSSNSTSSSASSSSSSGGDEPISYPTTTYDGPDEDGSQLWLRFPQVPESQRLDIYKNAFKQIVTLSNSETASIIEQELVSGLGSLTGQDVKSNDTIAEGSVVVGTFDQLESAGFALEKEPLLGSEGYLVSWKDIDEQPVIVVAGNTDIATLYGTYALLRHVQTHTSISNFELKSQPDIQHRVLNHWDNLNRSVERGYAGRSLWNWGALPGQLSPRYKEYARANASIGINGTVLTNVNADAQVLTASYLNKVKALADVFRPYGVKVYLTARFSAPREIGGQGTADPLNNGVRQWWNNKVDEIYKLIPDFGGFLVKANSEGQPGPQDYGRSHADGANMLAEALEPHGGIVMWRAFVYASSGSTDRIRQAYDEFKPLDGKFNDNVFVQPKNGALDFQPREPFHPMFGTMPKTPLALELQITKEYLGQDTHLAYLGTMYEEVLQAETYADGEGSTVAKVVDGSLHNYPATAIAGVSNIGTDANWTGSQFNQANWYVYGRMAWNPNLSAETAAVEWAGQTFSNAPNIADPIVKMMMMSREALVNYMTPLGLVHIMANTHHYGPGAWSNNLSRPEWNPYYYHKANGSSIGFDRTASGSNAVEQYHGPISEEFANRSTVPEEFLLFFHRVNWDDKLNSGRTLWEEMVHKYSLGVDEVQTIRDLWAGIESKIDAKRYKEISDHLHIQHYEARWWRDASLAYFASVSNKSIPSGYSPLNNSLNYYKGLNCPPNRDKPRCTQIEKGNPSPAILP